MTLGAKSATAGTSNGIQDDPLLTVRELAEDQGLTERQVRTLIAKAGLPAYDVGGIRIRRSEFEAWLATRRR